VAVEKDYNTFAGVPEVDPLLPEEVYEQIESDAAPLITRLGQPSLFLNDRERAAAALFISSLSLRVPRGRTFLKDVDEEFARAILLGTDREMFKQFLADTGQELSPEEAERQRLAMIDAVVNERVVIQAPQARTISHTLEMAIDLTQVFYDLEWTVLHPTGQDRFILSDSPVAMYDPRLPPHGANALLSSPDAQTTLPLDPRFALLMEAPSSLPPTGDPVLRQEDVDDKTVREINVRTYAWAQRWVYGQQHDVTQAHRRAKRNRGWLGEVSPREMEVRVRIDSEGLETTVRRRQTRAR
jgi:hypothetical protein